MEISRLQKKCNKTGAKAGANIGVKIGSKVPTYRQYFALREQVDKITVEDQKTYQSIESKSWKKIKENPEILFEYSR